MKRKRKDKLLIFPLSEDRNIGRGGNHKHVVDGLEKVWLIICTTTAG